MLQDINDCYKANNFLCPRTAYVCWYGLQMLQLYWNWTW